MSVDKLINILATIVVVEMMLTIGLGVRFSDITVVARRAGLVIRAALANYVLVPAAAIGLLVLFGAQPMVATGFMIAVVCPGAPYGPPFTSMAKGNVATSVGLMVILAGSSAIIAPVLLKLSLPWVAGDMRLEFKVVNLLGTLLFSQFIPLCIGLLIRAKRPDVAERWKRPFSRAGIVLNLVALTALVVAQYRMLADISLRGYVGMLILAAATGLAGLIFGGANREERVSMVLSTSVRNTGVGLVIATGSFPGTPAVMSATAYGVFQAVLMALVALAWGKMAAHSLHWKEVAHERGTTAA